MASNVQTNHDVKLYKYIDEPYSPYNTNYNTKNELNKQSVQNSSTKSKDKYSSILSSFNSMKSTIYKTLYFYLSKHNISNEMYNIQVINNIMFEEQKMIVSRLRNILMWDQSSDFLKRFYEIGESIGRLPQITNYYETYTLFSPVYFGFDNDILKIMLKHVKRKKRYLEFLEENEEKLFYKGMNNGEDCEHKEVQYVIDPKDIEESKSHRSNSVVGKSVNSIYKEYEFFINCQLQRGKNGNNSISSKVTFTEGKSNDVDIKDLFDITNTAINSGNKHIRKANIIHNSNTHIHTLNSTKVIEIKKLNLKNLNFISNKNTQHTKNKRNNNINNNANLNKTNTGKNTKSIIKNNIIQKTFQSKNKILYQKIRKALFSEKLSSYHHNIPSNTTRPVYPSIHYTHINGTSRFISKKHKKHKPKVNLIIQSHNIIKSFTPFNETKHATKNKFPFSKTRSPFITNTHSKKHTHLNTINFLNNSNDTISKKHRKHQHIITSPLQIPEPKVKVYKHNTQKKKKIPLNIQYTHSTSTSIHINPKDNSKGNTNHICKHFKTTTNNCSYSITHKLLSNKRKVSRNEHVNPKIMVSFLQTIHNSNYHQYKHKVLPTSSHQHHRDKSITLAIFNQHNKTYFPSKKHPLTSRNERESLSIELINKLLINKCIFP